MSDAICSIKECPTVARRRGWCQAHYRRWRLSGDPLGTAMRERRPQAADPVDVFWSRVVKSETCWLWTGGFTSGGYGTFKFQGKTYTAHRFAFTASGGVIPEGLTLDHLCRNRACVRPAHLEPVTQAENTRRARLARVT